MSSNDYNMVARLPVSNIADPRLRSIILKFIALHTPGRFGSQAAASVGGRA